MNDELKIAWAAGFLDGEGCFALTRSSGRGCHSTTRNPVIHVSQIDTRPLERLAELFGGEVKPFRVTSAGNLAYQWVIGGKEKIAIAVPQLLPHLVLKRAEAQALLDYCETIGSRGRGTPVRRGTIIKRTVIIAQHTSARRRGE